MECGEGGMHISKDILEVKSVKYGVVQNVDWIRKGIWEAVFWVPAPDEKGEDGWQNTKPSVGGLEQGTWNKKIYKYKYGLGSLIL